MTELNRVEAVSAEETEKKESAIVNEVYEASLEEAQPIISRHLDSLSQEQQGSNLESFLKSFWHFSEGIRLLRENADFVQANAQETLAAAGFHDLGLNNLESTCLGIANYCKAIVELRSLNVSRAKELFHSTEVYLTEAGEFGHKFQPLVEHMKPDALFVAALPQLARGNFNEAGPLIDQASEAYRKVAEKYYEPSSILHNTFTGLAYLSQSIFLYFKAEVALSDFNLDSILSKNSISPSPRQASAMLSKGDLSNKQIECNYYLALTIAELIDVNSGIAEILDRCINSSFKNDTQRFLGLKAKIEKARKCASKTGPEAGTWLNVCNRAQDRIQNLSARAKPQKLDFGIFSGLIVCALFGPLFFVASWVSKEQGLLLDGSSLLMTTAGLSLIGGFGFGALRFKNFLFGSPQ